MAKVMIMRKICKYFGHKENCNRYPTIGTQVCELREYVWLIAIKRERPAGCAGLSVCESQVETLRSYLADDFFCHF